MHFSTDYQDTSGSAQAYDPPLSFYNSRQDEDLSDTVLAGHLHAGADYGLNDKTALGLKLTYSMMGDIEASGGYSLHPFHGRNPVVRIDAAIRSASGARVQHWSSLFHELVFPVPPRKFPVRPNKFPVPWRREFETETQ